MQTNLLNSKLSQASSRLSLLFQQVTNYRFTFLAACSCSLLIYFFGFCLTFIGFLNISVLISFATANLPVENKPHSAIVLTTNHPQKAYERISAYLNSFYISRGLFLLFAGLAASCFKVGRLCSFVMRSPYASNNAVRRSQIWRHRRWKGPTFSTRTVLCQK
jgi:hypothetical protein